jgi:toxin ParE1/3/4
MKIRWTSEATDCLEHIGQHIAEDNPEAALKTVNTIFEHIEELTVFPNRGRLGREEGAREMVFSQRLVAKNKTARSAERRGGPIMATFR